MKIRFIFFAFFLSMRVFSQAQETPALVAPDNSAPPSSSPEEAVQETLRAFDASPSPSGFFPLPSHNSFAAVGAGPLEVSGGLLGLGAGPQSAAYGLGGAHIQGGYFASVKLDAITKPEKRTYARFALGATYAAPNARVFTGSAGPWADSTQDLLDLAGATAGEVPYSSQQLLYTGMQMGLSRAFGFFRPFYLVGAATAGVDAWSNVGEDSYLKYQGLPIPVPAIQSDAALALCFKPENSPFGFALSGGSAQDWGTFDSNSISTALAWDGQDPVGTFVVLADQAPHAGANAWLEIGENGLVDVSGRVMLTHNTVEQRYAGRVQGELWGMPSGMSVQIGHEEGDSIDYLRNSAMMGIETSPLALIGWDNGRVGLNYAVEGIDYGAASMEDGSVFLTVGGYLGKKGPDRGLRVKGQVAYGARWQNYESDPVKLEGVEETIELVSALGGLAAIGIDEEIEDAGKFVDDVNNGLLYALAANALMGYLNNGDSMVIGAALNARLSPVAPLSESDRQAFKNRWIDGVAQANDLVGDNFDSLTYDEKVERLSADLQERESGYSSVAQDMLADEIDQAADYLFDIAYSQGNRMILEAMQAAEELNRLTLNQGLKAPDVGQNAILEACWRARRR